MTANITYGYPITTGTDIATLSADDAFAIAIIPESDCTVHYVTFYGESGATGNAFKGVVWDSSGNVLTNGVGSIIYMTSGARNSYGSHFSTPPTLTAGNKYYIGIVANITVYIGGTSDTVSEYCYDGNNSYSSPNSFQPTSNLNTGSMWADVIISDETNAVLGLPYNNSLRPTTVGNYVASYNDYAVFLKMDSDLYSSFYVSKIRTYLSRPSAGSAYEYYIKFAIWDSSGVLVANSVSTQYSITSDSLQKIEHTYSTRPYLESGEDYYIGYVAKETGAYSIGNAYFSNITQCDYVGGLSMHSSNDFDSPTSISPNLWNENLYPISITTVDQQAFNILSIESITPIHLNNVGGAKIINLASSEGHFIDNDFDYKVWLINGALNTTLSNIYYDTDYYDTFTDSYVNKADKTYNVLQMHIREYGGIIYQFSGWQSGSPRNYSEKYSIASNTWSSMTVPTARNDAAANVHPDGYLFRTGGYAWTAENTKYTISSDSWAARTNYTRGSLRGMMGCAIGSMMFAVGGNNGTPTVYKYNMMFNDSTNGWSIKTEMSTARSQHGMTSDGENLSYAYGNNVGTKLSSIEQYNYTGNSWTSKTSSSYTAGQHTFSYARDGLCFQIYGTINGAVSQQNSQYNKNTDAWTTNTSSTETQRTYMHHLEATS